MIIVILSFYVCEELKIIILCLAASAAAVTLVTVASAVSTACSSVTDNDDVSDVGKAFGSIVDAAEAATTKMKHEND